MLFIKKKTIAEIPPASGSVSDTLNIDDKVTNAPSIRLVEEMIENVSGSTDDVDNTEIIENTNGVAVKYPDGRLECYHAIDLGNLNFDRAYGSIYLCTALGTFSWDFPVAFKETPKVYPSVVIPGGVGGVSITGESTTTNSGDMYLWHAISYSFTKSTKVMLHAIGYWK